MPIKPEEIKQLQDKAKQIRRDTLTLAKENNGYHFGGSFSIIELLTSLYDKVLSEEDRFILSKGHSCFPLYLLLREKGYEPKICGHPERDEKNGICATTGSLGHGLPFGVGKALGKKIKKESGRIYVLMGDGECEEGTTWESALLASHHKLDNLTIIVDNNGIQGSGRVENILSLGNLEKKFLAFGCDVSVIDGHDFNEIIPALKKNPQEPYVIIAKTIKGKGVSYMENNPEWHSKFPDPEKLKQAYKELE
ncbi:1-deoxy-D-xylulose-5-phosphate synthase [uncultured archaeon]|nr:1-deoxy-D-xylulose-5-phosphate synthase [uncultured archaeon]